MNIVLQVSEQYTSLTWMAKCFGRKIFFSSVPTFDIDESLLIWQLNRYNIDINFV